MRPSRNTLRSVEFYWFSAVYFVGSHKKDGSIKKAGRYMGNRKILVITPPHTHIYKMKYTLYAALLTAALLALFLLASCYPFNLSLKPGDFLDPGSVNPPVPVNPPAPVNPPGPVGLDLGSYRGDYTITYKDESVTSPFKFPVVPAATGKTIKSITVNGNIHLIGRPDTDRIRLKIRDDGGLEFRDPDDDGFIPIGSYAEFQLISTDNASRAEDYRQEADLDLMNLEWNPVGVPGDGISGFTGTFDGSDHRIDNLHISSGSNPAGLFGHIGSGGTVEKVHIRSGSVTGNSNAGGIAATNFGTVNACSSAADVTGFNITGGIVGNNTGTITACCNTGAVSGSSGNTGGVVGANYNKITACYNTGAVSDGVYTGGVVGQNTSQITACYNTGAVSDGVFMGGVAGQNTYQITACYNTGAVSGSSVYVGGVVGRLDYGSVVSSYWANAQGGNASYGIGYGSSDPNGPAAPFSDTNWPTSGTHVEWGIGDDGSGSGKYWKSLGGWNDGNPVYPRLWYE
jgi:hypothetical protein